MTRFSLYFVAAATFLASGYALSPPLPTVIYSYRRDVRKCARPACGGIFLKHLNYGRTLCPDGKKSDRNGECYVGEVEWPFETSPNGYGLVEGLLEGKSKDHEYGILQATRSWRKGCSSCDHIRQPACAPPPPGCNYQPKFDTCGCSIGCGTLRCDSSGALDGEPREPFRGFNCPAIDNPFLGACVEECSSDRECSTGSSCCFNGCGHACTKISECSADPCKADQKCVEVQRACLTTPCPQFDCVDKAEEGDKCKESSDCQLGLYCSNTKCVGSPGKYYGVKDNGNLCLEEPCPPLTLTDINRGTKSFNGQLVLSNARAGPSDISLAKKHSSSTSDHLIVASHNRFKPVNIDGKARKRYLYGWEVFLLDTPEHCLLTGRCQYSVYHTEVTSKEGCYCLSCPRPVRSNEAFRNEESFKEFKCAKQQLVCPQVRCAPVPV